ncbi:MAG: hypothetical protein ACRDH6_03975 [Actinomycetota bacterium]
MRARRRRVLTIALEALGLTALMGAFPQFRALWVGAGALAVFLLLYVALLLWLRVGQQASSVLGARLRTARLVVLPGVRSQPAAVLAGVEGEDYGLRSVRVVAR